MLGKELLLNLTPTEEEGIFLLTIDDFYTEGPSFAGFSNNGHFTPNEYFGDLFGDRPDYIVRGTDSEYFDTSITSLLETQSGIGLSFYGTHKPNVSGTVIYFHMKQVGIYGPISAELVFPVNKSFAFAEYVSVNNLNNLVGQTIRIYLGPSPTPPPISLRDFLREVLYAK